MFCCGGEGPGALLATPGVGAARPLVLCWRWILNLCAQVLPSRVARRTECRPGGCLCISAPVIVSPFSPLTFNPRAWKPWEKGPPHLCLGCMQASDGGGAMSFLPAPLLLVPQGGEGPGPLPIDHRRTLSPAGPHAHSLRCARSGGQAALGAVWLPAPAAASLLGNLLPPVPWGLQCLGPDVQCGGWWEPAGSPGLFPRSYLRQPGDR